MSERVNDERITEFGMVGIIGLASLAAMRRHKATLESMRVDPDQASAASRTQGMILERFAADYPEDVWNNITEAEASAWFDHYDARDRGE